jgi:hypothetical protein
MPFAPIPGSPTCFDASASRRKLVLMDIAYRVPHSLLNRRHSRFLLKNPLLTSKSKVDLTQISALTWTCDGQTSTYSNPNSPFIGVQDPTLLGELSATRKSPPRKRPEGSTSNSSCLS